MQISARNKLSGTVTSVKLGGVMAEVVIRVGDNEIVSVTAIIKSTEVMLAK